LAAILCAGLLLCALPQFAYAATEEEEEELLESTSQSYHKSLGSTGKESLQGFCGMMTSHQLYHMGINKYLLTYDGNQQYDAYKDLFKTTGGYYIRAYDAKDYTLEQALNEISRFGTRDVYNIVVGFQWTNTEAGGTFGHSCVINGILNGKVYFMEGFYMPFGGPEGNVSVCTIAEFAEYFGDWTVFEGVIYFGSGEYADACEVFGTDLMVRPRFNTTLRSQPCVVGKHGSRLLRSVSAGEQLRVTAVVKNTENELFYQVQDGQWTGYIVANTAVVTRVNAEELSLTGYQFPQTMSPGTDPVFSGTITAKYGLVGAVELTVQDATGKEVLSQRHIADSVTFDLQNISQTADFSGLEKGLYTVTLRAETTSACVSADTLDYRYEGVCLDETVLTVGDIPPAERIAPLHTGSAKLTDGWFWQNDTWYCYENGAPVTGWVRNMGVRYYLREDGSVTTGWAEIDGKAYYFNANGAVNTGWLDTPAGMRYSLPDGTFVTGWYTIDASRYYFGTNGILQTEGVVNDGGNQYTLLSDGRAVHYIRKQKQDIS